MELLIQMVLNKHSKEKEISIHETTTYEEQIANLKEATFTVLGAHLQQNCEASPYAFYLFLLLEHLALLWYLLHPGLNVYQQVYLISEVSSFLRTLNPHQLLANHPDFYRSLVLGAGLYLLLQWLLGAVSIFATLRGKSGQFFKYLRKIVNYQFLFTAKAASGPLLAIVVNVVYCDPKSPYHLGHTCYGGEYVLVCAAAGLVGLVVVIEVLLLALVYYIRNPLNSSYMGVQNRYYVLSKSIIKVLMPLYFAVDPALSLSIVYKFTVTGLWAAYIFWHRLFSVHSYNQRHFYVEFFLEAGMLWVAASNLIYWYASNGPTVEEFSFIYTLLSACLVSGLLLSIEARAENCFLKQCLSGKVKKQNMEKFIFVLIHRLLYCPPADSRVRLKTYRKLLAKNSGLKTESEEELSLRKEGEEHTEVYQFLSQLLEGFLQENNSTMLKAVRCHLSCLLGLRSHGIHQSLELEEQRLSLVEELMLFQFRRSIDLFEHEGNDKENREFLKFYRFHEEFGRLEAYVEACGKNNSEYWEELCEADPSLAKLRNLATLYSLYEARITQQYTKITELVPESLHAATLYLSFLTSVAVDARAQLRMREKLSSICEARSKSTKISTEEIREDEEMSIITLDTIGNNLGVVLNANSHVRDLLGFEKAALVGKNITKIMPKIYTELHNSFMLGFIRSRNSHQTSVKRVTALNRNSLLVDINLSVRILSSSQSDLAIVGFMKPLPVEQFVGLVMYSLNTLEVLGIDENFVEMMNRRLSGKQVAQEEVRLTVLVPELNLELLEKEKEQETVLEVGSSLEEEGDLEVQKRVNIRLKGLKVYEGVRLGFLEVYDLARYQALNSRLASSCSSRIPRFATKEIVASDKVARPPHKKRTQDLSINLEESQRALNESMDGFGREVAINRRVEQFVKGREGRSASWALKGLYCVCVLGCLATALYAYFSHVDYLRQKQELYLSLNQTLSVASYEAAINTYVEKIWSIDQNNYATSNYSVYFPLLNGLLVELKNTYSQLTTSLSDIAYPLEYNELNFYNFSFSEGVNGSLLQNIRPSTYADSISNYITAANIFTQAFINNETSTQRLILQIEALFVQQNGEALLPSIAIAAVDKYYQYFSESLGKELRRMAVVKALLMVVIVVCFLCILLLAHYLDRINLLVVQVYSGLHLADVAEVLLRCNRFLGQRGLKMLSKQRTSSLFRMPNSTKHIHLPEKHIPITVSQPKPREEEVLTTEEPLILHTQPVEERMSTLEYQQAEVEPGEGEEALLRGKEKEVEATIKVEEERSNTRIVAALMVFFKVFGAVIGVEYYQISANTDNLQQYMHRLKVIGEVKKTLNLIDYYAYRISLANQDAHTKGLLVAEIGEFFALTQEGYVYLGDPQPILKDTYSIIETIQQWLTVPAVTSQGILFASYPLLDSGLQDTVAAINLLDSSTFFPQFVQEVGSASAVELVFTLLLIGLMCLAVVALHSLHLGPIRAQGRHSLNMLRIMPASLLQRNPKALKTIASS